MVVTCSDLPLNIYREVAIKHFIEKNNDIIYVKIGVRKGWLKTQPS